MTDKRIVLITGANTGLGYQIVRSLLSSDRASTILLGGRSIGKANEARDAAVAEQPGSKSSIDVVQIDIEDDSSIQALCKTVESKYGKLDVLVNNAGAQFDEEYKAGRMTVRQAWSKSWDLNVVSTHILTDALMPMLLRSDDPRLLFVASGTSSLTLSENTDLPFSKARPKGWPKPWGSLVDGTPAYKSSKTGMNMMMREWQRTLVQDGVKVWAVSPGFLATGLGRQDEMKRLGALDPSIGGAFVTSVIDGARDADAGKVVSRAGIQPW